VLELDATGKYAGLYNFAEADGVSPYAGLIGDTAGNLYGTTAIGGASGYGTVFKMDASGKETVLHSFTGGTDGGYPFAGVIQDAKGNFYGTTEQGGSGGYGTVWQITK